MRGLGIGIAVLVLVGASCTADSPSDEALPGLTVIAGFEQDLYEYRSAAGARDLEAALQLVAPSARGNVLRNLDFAYGDKVDVAPEPSKVTDYVVLSATEAEIVAQACLVRSFEFINPDGSRAGPPGTEVRLLMRYEFGFYGEALLIESGERIGTC